MMPEPAQRLGARRPDALEVGDRRVEIQALRARGARSVTRSLNSSRANSVGSKGTRSAAALADAEELDRHVDRLVHGDDDAAARRAVELRDDEAGHRHRGGEHLRLLHRVLADRAVEHEQRLVRRAGQPLGDDARDFLELVHQVLRSCAGGRPCRRSSTSTPRAMAASIASNATAAGSAPALRADELGARALRPDAQLIDRAGAERVARRDHHALLLAAQRVG